MSDKLKAIDDNELDKIVGGALSFGRNGVAFDTVSGKRYRVNNESKAKSEYAKLSRKMSSEDAINTLISKGYLE